MKITLQELTRLAADSAFLKPLGLVVEACAPGECSVRIPYARALERPGGVLSGIAIMGAADVAMWMAIQTLRGPEEPWVTTDMKTAFLRGARGTDVLCTARVLKLGNRTAYGTADCRGANGELLAHHVLSYTRVGE